MLTGLIQKIKDKMEPHKSDIFVAIVIVLVSIVGFGLGRLSVIYERKKPIKIEYLSETQATTGALLSAGEKASIGKEKLYVASKNSDKYHLPWCSSAKRIKEANQIWFASKDEARISGFSPAENCDGL